MNYEKLKQFCNSLNEEQLQQEVYVAQVDSSAIKVDGASITDNNKYFDHTDCLGTLEEIKEQNPTDWEDIIIDAVLIEKGTVILMDEG